MSAIEKWIWLPRDRYPENQTTAYNAFNKKDDGHYTVAELRRTYKFDKRVTSAVLRFSGDTFFRLFLNGAVLAEGPAAVGGDFLGNGRARDNYYSYELAATPDGDTLAFEALVRMKPHHICEYSMGHGGFMLTAVITFADGTKKVIHTDKTWEIRRVGAYVNEGLYDGRIPAEEFTAAEEIPNLWKTATAPIPPVEQELRTPRNGSVLTLAPHSEAEFLFDLDKIYAGHICLSAVGEIAAEVWCRETGEEGSHETVILRDGGYTGTRIHSAGELLVKAKNDTDADGVLAVSFVSVCYPVTHTAVTVTSDPELNKVLDICRHSLRYCRQSLHLDSPRHCEPLACTGDYYIESLMTAFSFGDLRLAEFDLIRTAELLRREDGRMFHTTYSLIWVMMLRDMYRYTGHLSLLTECEDALLLLLDRFTGYLGENGLIETPPDYMFVDWVFIDGISMHHPPKALGQTVLNLYYYGALTAAAEIYTALGEGALAADCLAKQAVLGNAVNTLLYDPRAGMYFEGLNTPTPEHLLYRYMPQNTDKRYSLKQSNILAAYVNVAGTERSRELIHKIMADEIPGDYQPYFAHFLFEAIVRNGLREEYTLKLAEQWKAPVLACEKGLPEGFVKPEPTYSFDHSHAWAGTPLYSVPFALMGLEILEPGLRKIRLKPSLLGLEEATVTLPTQWGDVTLTMKAGEPVGITKPDQVEVLLG